MCDDGATEIYDQLTISQIQLHLLIGHDEPKSRKYVSSFRQEEVLMGIRFCRPVVLVLLTREALGGSLLS